MSSKSSALKGAGIFGAALVLSLLGTIACKNLKPEPTPAVQPSGAAATANEEPDISFRCLEDHFRNAPAPFHWSYRRSTTASGDGTWEADITNDSIDGTVVDSTGKRNIRAKRSDTAAWSAAVVALAAPLPGGTFGLVQNSSARARAGVEQIGGEESTKYTIDTGRDSAADASLIKRTMGDGGFVRGTVWVAPDGCPVKLTLDAEQHLSDGTVESEHYDAAVTKK